MRRICGAVLLLLAVLVTPLQAQTIYWTGSISTAGADCSVTTRCLVITDLRTVPSLGVYLDVGTSGTFAFEATIDGTNWFAVPDDVAGATTATADGAYYFANPGYRSFRVRASAISGAAALSVSRGSVNLRSTATLTGGGGDGALIDGVSAAIKATVKDLTNSNPLTTQIVDANGDAIVTFGGGTQYTQDAALTVGSTIGTVAVGRASAAAPTDVSADNDAVIPWYLRSGAQASVITAGGALIGGDASNGLDVDVTRVPNDPFGANADAASATGSISAKLRFIAATGIPITGTVTVGDGSGALNVICDSGCSGGTQYTHDAALTIGSSVGGLAMGRASAAVPTGVSADDDAVAPWYLRSGAQAMVLTAAGALIGGDATNGIDVDVTRVTGTVTVDSEVSTAAAASDDFANPTSGGVLSFNMCFDGSTWDRCRASTATEQTHDTAVTATSVIGGSPLLLAKDFDGAALPNVVSAEGDAVLPSASLYGVQYMMLVSEDGSLQYGTATTPLVVGDGTGALNVICDSGCGSGTQYTHDAALTIGSSSVTLSGGRASAAVPTDVSADNDAVAAWYLRSGAQAVQPTFGGVLGVAGNGASGTGVQRVTIANDSTGILAAVTSITNTVTVAGAKTNNNAAPGATNVGALTGLANAAAPSWSEGNLVALSTDLAGALRVAGAVSCSNCTGTGASKVDDAAFTIATDSVAPAGYLFDDVATDSVNEGDVGLARMSGNRVPYGILRDAAGNERGANVTASNALVVDGSAVTQPVSLATNAPVGSVAHDAAAAAVNPLLIGAFASAAAPSDVSADTDSVRVWALRNGSPVVNLAAGGTLITSSGANLNANIGQINGVTPLMNAGNTGTGSLRVTVATDQAALAGLAIYVEDAGETAGGNLAMVGGVRRDTLASSAASNNENATFNLTTTGALYVAPAAATNGGAAPCYITSAASTNATNCKASAGNLYGVEVINTTSTLYYLRLYNLGSAPTCSSATGFVRTIPIPHNTGTGAGIANFYSVGEEYSTGIGFCLTGGGASTDNTNAATGVYVTLQTK